MVYQRQVVTRALIIKKRANVIELLGHQTVALPMHLMFEDNTLEHETAVIGKVQSEPEERFSAKGACRVPPLAVRRVLLQAFGTQRIAVIIHKQASLHQCWPL